MNGDANPVSSLMSILTQINDYFSTETNLQNFSTWRCFFVLQLGKVLHRLSRCKVKAIRKTNQMIYPTVRFVTVCHQMRVLCLENCLNFSNFLFSPQHAIDHNRRGTSTEQADTISLRLPGRLYRPNLPSIDTDKMVQPFGNCIDLAYKPGPTSAT